MKLDHNRPVFAAMKITRISVYQKTLDYVGGTYVWGPNCVLSDADSTVVVLETDSGLTGCGEVCPIEGNYLAAYAEGVRAAMPRLGKAILGLDPRQVALVSQAMDAELKGHGYAKTPVDMACWDILGKSTGQPVWMLMGGKLNEKLPMYRVAPMKSVEETVAEMEQIRAQGYRQFQVKVGGDWQLDIERIRNTIPLLKDGEIAFADANTGWRVDHAIRVCRAVQDLDVYIEQPCMTYEECLQVRRNTDLPMKLDECITSLEMAERAVKDKAAEVICIKVSKQGGLSAAKRLRDYLVEKRIPMVVEDTWGGEIVTAALSHLAASTPAELHVNSTDLHNYVSGSTGTPAPRTENGCLLVTDTPGLGVEPDYNSLGEPVAVYTL